MLGIVFENSIYKQKFERSECHTSACLCEHRNKSFFLFLYVFRPSLCTVTRAVYKHEKILCHPKVCCLPIRDDGYIYRLIQHCTAKGYVAEENCIKCVKEVQSWLTTVRVQILNVFYIRLLYRSQVPSHRMYLVCTFPLPFPTCVSLGELCLSLIICNVMIMIQQKSQICCETFVNKCLRSAQCVARQWTIATHYFMYIALQYNPVG